MKRSLIAIAGTAAVGGIAACAVMITPLASASGSNPIVTLFASWTIPGDNARGIQVSPDGRTVYATSAGSNIVSFLDAKTGATLLTVPTGAYPTDPALLPNGSALYIANSHDGTVSVINTKTHVVTATIPVPSGNKLEGTVAQPNGAAVWVVDSTMNTAWKINPVSNSIVGSVSTGNYPWGTAISPDSSTLYVANSNDGTINRINTATNVVTGTLWVGTQPQRMRISPDGTHLYVSSGTSPSSVLTVVNTKTFSVAATVPVGSDSTDVAITKDGKTAFVSNFFSDSVSVVNTLTNTVTQSLPTSPCPSPQCYPYEAVLSPDGSRLYVAIYGDPDNFPSGPANLKVFRVNTARG